MASALDLDITLTTYNLNNNITFTYSVSSINEGDSPNVLANKISTQLSTYLVQNSHNFSGRLYYQDQEISEATFNVTRTNQCVAVWGQSQFDVTVANDTGAIIKVRTRPCLVTIAEARDTSAITGITYTNGDGEDLTDDQLGSLLCLASADLCSYLKNNISLTTYMQHETTSWQYGIFVSKTPFVDYWAPQCRIPQVFTYLSSTAIYSTAKQNYSMDVKSGMLSYRFAQNLIGMYEPFDYANEILLSYIAGYYNIPEEIKTVICSYASQLIGRLGEDVESYKGGSFQVKYASTSEGFNEYIAVLRPYFLSGD